MQFIVYKIWVQSKYSCGAHKRFGKTQCFFKGNNTELQQPYMKKRQWMWMKAQKPQQKLEDKIGVKTSQTEGDKVIQWEAFATMLALSLSPSLPLSSLSPHSHTHTHTPRLQSCTIWLGLSLFLPACCLKYTLFSPRKREEGEKRERTYCSCTWRLLELLVLQLFCPTNGSKWRVWVQSKYSDRISTALVTAL